MLAHRSSFATLSASNIDDASHVPSSSSSSRLQGDDKASADTMSRQSSLKNDEQLSDIATLAERMSSDPMYSVRLVSALDPHTAERLAAVCQLAASGRLQDTSSLDSITQPSARQLWKLTVRTAVPFIGFGFFDNTIMLTVGETIDVTLGVAFCFSTLAAAGMGQMVSDAAGITLQGIIERFADRLGLPDPKLSPQQQSLGFVRTWTLAARIVGIVLGCMLGMFPLLLMPEKRPRLVDQIAQKLSSDQRREFTQLVKTLHFNEGEKLLEWGQTSENVYMVQSGQVDVIGRDIDGVPFSVCTIGPGHAFGIPALHAPSHVDLIAKDDSVVVSAIEKDDFLRVTGKEGMEVFESARSIEHAVYLRSQGEHCGWEAKKGTGKSRFFASLSPQEKLEVLLSSGLSEVAHFKGMEHEGKVRFFANLPEEVKRNALLKWQQLKYEQHKRNNGHVVSTEELC